MVAWDWVEQVAGYKCSSWGHVNVLKLDCGGVTDGVHMQEAVDSPPGPTMSQPGSLNLNNKNFWKSLVP